jgi:hypothetical protein
MTIHTHTLPLLTGRYSRRAGLALLAALGLAAGGQTEIQARKHRHHQGTHCDRPALRCGKRCVNLGTDPQHCGSCGRQCAATELCQEGQCVTASALPPEA